MKVWKGKGEKRKCIDCSVLFERTGRRHKRCAVCAEKNGKLVVKDWNKTHKDERNKHSKTWSENHTIWRSLSRHHRWIFVVKHPNYIGMPFFDAWNPDKGGRFSIGEKYLLPIIGSRPAKNYDLHVVDRSIGIFPNNLIWIPRERHKREEFLYALLLENKKLKEMLEGLCHPEF